MSKRIVLILFIYLMGSVALFATNPCAGLYPKYDANGALTCVSIPISDLPNLGDDKVLLGGASANTTPTLPSCTDTGGNHLNYDPSSNTFSCGTSSTGSACAADEVNVGGTCTTLPDCDDTGGNHLNYDTTAHTFSCGTSGGGSAHDLLSATHTDTVTHTAVLGDTVYANSTPAWQALAGNTTSTKKFLTQTGTGSVSAAPGWNTVASTDIPDPVTTQSTTVAKDLNLSNSIAPSSLSSQTDDWNPTGLSTASIINVTTTTTVHLTGITAQSDGRVIILINKGSNPLVLDDQSTSSSANNRFDLAGSTSGVTLNADGAGIIVYQAGSYNRWRFVSGKIKVTGSTVSAPNCPNNLGYSLSYNSSTDTFECTRLFWDRKYRTWYPNKVGDVTATGTAGESTAPTAWGVSQVVTSNPGSYGQGDACGTKTGTPASGDGCGFYFNSSLNWIRLNFSIWLMFDINSSSTTSSSRIYAALTSTNSISSYGTGSASCNFSFVGFVADSTASPADWYACSCDASGTGSSYTCTDTGVAYSNSTHYVLEMDCSAKTACDFWINGTNYVTKSSTWPSTATSMGWLFGVETLTSATRSFTWYQTSLTSH